MGVRKGIKLKSYNAEIKAEIIERHLEKGEGPCLLSREYNIPKTTIINWFRKTSQGINVLDNNKLGKSGRKAKSEIGYKERYEILKKMEEFLKEQREKKPSL